jgi:hypothetical protein
MSEAMTIPFSGRFTSGAEPERLGPKGQERER